jgi:transcription termination factor Rho
MSVLDRAALEESPLADLHALASELSIDGYRRLRRDDLIDAILERQGGADADDEPAVKPTRGSRRSRSSKAAEAVAADDAAEDELAAVQAEEHEPTEEEETERGSARAEAEEEEQPSGRRRRGRRGGRGRGASRAERAAEDAEAESDGEDAGPERGNAEPADAEAAEPVAAESEGAEPEAAEEDQAVEGVVELLPNGSGFLRVSPPEPSDDDVYISAAQVKRCELVSGDRVAGPRRGPRRSERFASLVRIDTINGRPSAELVSGTRFEDLPAAFPDERLQLASEDPTIRAIDTFAPFGKGSRVTIVGGPRAGKSEALRRIAAALDGREDIQLSIALAGVRPEEIGEWRQGPVEPIHALSFAASSDAQDNAVELVIDQARRIASRGAHAVVLIDTLEWLHPHAARRALAAARKIVDGGSLTVIATAPKPLGGETTVIVLDAMRRSLGQFPTLDVGASGTIRPELLVGEAGAQEILAARQRAAAQ